MWCNDQVKAVVKRQELLGASDEDARERSLEIYKEEKRKVKSCIYESKEVVQNSLEGR